MERTGRAPGFSALPLVLLAAGAPGDSCDRRAVPPASHPAVISPAPAAPARAPNVAETPTPFVAAAADEPTMHPATFQATVAPILSTRCAPCHFPGGKMYARLPFDRPATLADHRDGVRRRLKGDDLAAFERWLATVSESAPKSEAWK